MDRYIGVSGPAGTSGTVGGTAAVRKSVCGAPGGRERHLYGMTTTFSVLEIMADWHTLRTTGEGPKEIFVDVGSGDQ